MKPDQKAQQTQLDELFKFVEECQGEPIDNENPSSQHEQHEQSTVQEEVNAEPVDNQPSTNVCEPPSTPIRMRKNTSISEQKTPSRETRLSARKRNSHLLESGEQEVEGNIKIARVEDK